MQAARITAPIAMPFTYSLTHVDSTSSAPTLSISASLICVLEAMREYNRCIYEEKQSRLSDPLAYETAPIDLKEYGIIDGIVAVLTIPALELEMPIYLGASYDNMAAGAAVLGQTSLPIGGVDTNCVIAGHRGWHLCSLKWLS